MSATKRHAIVIGGGIGGLAAAIALQQHGWSVTVYERASELHEVGAGLSLWANAMRALDQLGVAEPIRALRPARAPGGIFTWRGTPLISQPAETPERGYGDLSVVVHRAELHKILLQAAGPCLRLNKQCTAVAETSQAVQARFADGDEATGELLIGADGLRSVVRAQLVGDGEPRYAGYTAWRGVASFDPARLRPGEYWGSGARFGMAPMNAGRVYWYATLNVQPGRNYQPAAQKALLEQTFRGWSAPIEALIAATPAQRMLHNDIADRAPLQRWSRGRITLLGDAAHPMTPNLGQGACQALEDAVALGECLDQHDVAGALRAYEQRRVSRANRFVVQSRRIGWLGQWSNPVACSIRNALVRSVLGPLQARSLDRNLGGS